ncbi:MAG TPA: hypothetical protein PLD47_06635 [Aggregatilineales bacterium]|nr:hypothetical protein [Anaerolineales bacterium]HRE47385.1 hypothetical protein [Aggregatilineales bacterium]
MVAALSLDEITAAAEMLSLVDKLVLMQRLTGMIQDAAGKVDRTTLATMEDALTHIGLSPTEDELAEVRRQMAEDPDSFSDKEV